MCDRGNLAKSGEVDVPRIGKSAIPYRSVSRRPMAYPPARFTLGIIVTLAAFGCFSPNRPCIGQEADGEGRRDSWARFMPGDWKSVNVTTQSFDARGNLTSTSTTRTKTTVTGIEESAVCLQIEVEVEVAGKTFKNPPQLTKQGFTGEPVSRDVQVHAMKPVELVINERVIPCRVEKREYDTPEGHTTVFIYRSDEIAPYVLQREAITTKPDSDAVVSKTTMKVIALDMPSKVMTEIKPTAIIRIVEERPTGKTVTIAYSCEDVPGGTVWQSSKEVNKDGLLVRRSLLDLVDYGTNGEPEAVRLFPRLRGGRVFRRPAP